jgi:hypothetical protein
MPVLSLVPVAVGQCGVNPLSFKMTTRDSLATVTTAGYLVQGVCGQFLSPNSVIETIYLYGSAGATTIFLSVAIDQNGVITLSSQAIEGLGQAAAKAVSNNALPSVASVNGATTVGGVATFSDTAGTVGQSPAAFRAQVATYAGGSASFSITDANVVVGDVVNVTFATQANPASILRAVAAAGSITIVASADPGASTVNYMAVKAQ